MCFSSLKVIFLLVKIYHFTQLKKLKKRTTPQTFFCEVGVLAIVNNKT